MNRLEIEDAIKELGAKPSISEENGLELLTPNDLLIFCPGISTGGIAEIRMALDNPNRKIIATTIDEKGYNQALSNIRELSLEEQVQIRLEDLTKEFPYGNQVFDYVYARLILHYLSFEELNTALRNLNSSLKKDGKLYTVVRSVKNTEGRDLPYDPITRFSKEPWGNRYFHSVESISSHLLSSGFEILDVKEYQEQLYSDFMRTKPSSMVDHVIAVTAKKI